MPERLYTGRHEHNSSLGAFFVSARGGYFCDAHAFSSSGNRIIAEGLRQMKTGYPGLFIPGPTNIPERVRQAMAIPLEDQRAPDFPAFTLPLFADLKKVFKTAGGQVFIFPAPARRDGKRPSPTRCRRATRCCARCSANSRICGPISASGTASRSRRSRSSGARAFRSRNMSAFSRPTAATASRRCWPATTRRRPA